ncbi:GntR family transcriptional regulator [Spiractinospora alimapuensis]|uniref:GntR family transcriptional regulator n=1 Tax=Spiractinospora alimapuensis TaxID=2820884 RepID=UPI001F261907|nr:GntR family transcriptional regulator [Spiractinospora alimapuensis]QVQ52379.1 GntR family transcriptional regulator [Spiractinospora alimapuensis]
MRRINGDRNLAGRILVELREAIVSGELPPGTLYSVHDLAARLGVSRTPVREALLSLADRGMVRFERNRGIRILQTSIRDLEEIFELRLLLEVPATYRATQLMSARALNALRAHLEGMERAAARGDEDRLWERDRRFHMTINETSGNTRLAGYVDQLRDVVLLRGVSTARSSRSIAAIIEEHREILEYIEVGDAEGAASAMRAHLCTTARLLAGQEADEGGDGELSLDWTAWFTPPGSSDPESPDIPQ